MPRKIRELKAELRRAGFSQVEGGGKGSHTKWKHPNYKGSVTLAGHDGDDAQPYQEDDVREAINAVK